MIDFPSMRMTRFKGHWLAGLVAGIGLAGPVDALELRGPDLAAASNFGQGFQRDYLSASREIPVRDFRDGVYWSSVDLNGVFAYTTPKTRYPMLLGGAGMSLTVNNGHPDFSDGNTPTDAGAVARFGLHAARTVDRYPNIHSVEVGNEFNSANFISGPLKTAGLDARAVAYVALLKSVYRQVKAVNPETLILGGGVHSIPTGYLDKLLALGAARYMDRLVLHPYDTPVEIFGKQVEVLRRRPEWAEMPLEVTEFGSQDPKAAPGFFLRSYCEMALAGVHRAAWYALNPRGDDFAPLIDLPRGITDIGRVFAYADRYFAGRSVRAFRPDPFTYGCQFGERSAVLWGVPREFAVRGNGLSVLNTRLDPVQGPVFLSETEPLILIGENPLELDRDVFLGDQALLADSYYQFSYPGGVAPASGFIASGRFGDQDIPFQTMPGQGRGGVPWTPYLGTDRDAGLRLLSETLLPSGSGAATVEIVHTYTAPRAQVVDLDLMLAPIPRSEDGIEVAVTVSGKTVIREKISGERRMVRTGVALIEGDRVEIAVGPNGTARGDVTGYRYRIWDNALR